MIRSRLFWKILLGFLVTFMAMSQVMWLLARIDRDRPLPPQIVHDHVAPAAMAAAVQAVESGGPQRFAQLLHDLPDRTASYLSIEPVPGRPVAEDGNSVTVTRRVNAPDGRGYIVRFSAARDRPASLFNIPWFFAVAAFGAGLVFASVLAWYLIAPLRRLRAGFRRLAGGDLDTRISPAIGGRRDEITELAHDFDWMARRLQLLVENQDRVLHDVSHELRSPLARLQLATELARQSPARTDQSLDRIEHEVERLDALVGELLTLARAESEFGPGDEYFDPIGVVESVGGDVRYEAEPGGITIAISAPMPDQRDDLPPLRGGAELVRRAVENVLRNALRFSPAGGTIDVHVDFHAAQNAYQITVDDDGPGVDPAMSETMFEPFVRGATAGSGPGLGLAIASRAIAAHGGTISARNRANGGLRVTLILPAPTT